MKNSKFTYEEAIKKINAIGGKPIVVEAQWDGDTQGWFLGMFVVVEKGIQKIVETHYLGTISLGGDIRLFQGTVPPYPEAVIAQEIGNKLKEKYKLEFFFPSPINPDDDCPRWTEKDKAINCKDCNKLIIPTDSPYLPKEVCYHCHLKSKQNLRIINKKPHDDGVTMYLYKNGIFQQLGYCTEFKSFPIAPFIQEKVDNRRSDLAISIVTLEQLDIEKLIQDLEHSIDKQILEYKAPNISKAMSKFVTVNQRIYKGKKYGLMDRFNAKHEHLSHLFSSLKKAKKAKEENYEYKIYFKNGITYRDDAVLRFLNYPQKGTTTIDIITKKYKGILSTIEVKETLNKLEHIGCIALKEQQIVITQTGKNIV